MLPPARTAVASIYRTTAADSAPEWRADFEGWFSQYEALHGPLERRRLIDRDEVGRVYRLDADDLDLPRLLWSIELVSSLVLSRLAACAYDGKRPGPGRRMPPATLRDYFGAVRLCRSAETIASPEALEAASCVATALVDLKREDPFADAYRVLFHGLVPRHARHALGAFFTPGWLAHRVVATADPRPSDRVVDPSAGSGVMLLETARRLRASAAAGLISDAEALDGFSLRLAGQEINSLSAVAARVNLLWAASAFTRGRPDPDCLPRFVTGDVLTADDALTAEGPFDAIVGNPPWVNWEHLPPDYRAKIEPMWPPLGLFAHTGRAKAWSKEDVSVLFTYVALERLLKPGGVLAFLVPASLFKSSMNGRGFRRFRLGANGDHLRVGSVEEFERIRAFGGAAGKAALVKIQRGAATQFPVEYNVTAPASGAASPGEDTSHADAAEMLETRQFAARPSAPSDEQSPWMTLDDEGHANVAHLLGENPYRGRTGFFTGGANGVYHMEVFSGEEQGCVHVRNITARAKRPVPQREAVLEPDFVFPFLQGRDIRDWIAVPSVHVLCPHTPETGMRPVPPDVLGRTAPRTLQWFEDHREILAERRGFGGWEKDLLAGGFYAGQRIGVYTFAEYKVVWRYIAPRFMCAVCGPGTVAGQPKPVIPNEKVMLIACGSSEEAYYVCGFLSSTKVRSVIDSRAIGTQMSPSIIANIAIPPFDPASDAHRAVAAVCEAGHGAGAGLTPELAEELDDAVALVTRGSAVCEPA